MGSALRALIGRLQELGPAGRLALNLIYAVARLSGRRYFAGVFLDYDEWIRRQPCAPAGRGLAVTVVVPVYQPDMAQLEEAVASVLEQAYEPLELVLCDDGSGDNVRESLRQLAGRDARIKLVERSTNGGIAAATNSAIAAASGDWVAFLDQDDRLAQGVLSACADAMSDDAVQLVYTDEDKIDRRGRRHDPYFKPDFSRALLYGRNYLNHLTLVRRSALTAVDGLAAGYDGAQDFELVLRVLDAFGPAAIRHVPVIGYHWRQGHASGSFSDRHREAAAAAGEQALKQHLRRLGGPSDVTLETRPVGRRVHFDGSPDASDITAIIPTRDRIDLVARAVDQLGDEISVIIVDNGSTEPASREWLQHFARSGARRRVVRDDTAFNFSRLVNLGAARAETSKLLILNNDVHSAAPGWLAELAGWAGFDWAGCVGARLDYPDGRLQHGGVLLGLDAGAGHFMRGAADGAAGPFGHLQLVRGVSAVTAACLMIRKQVFDEVGGFDEHDFPVTFSDVDFCLRVRAAGYENIWTPFARLTHEEGSSRGRTEASAAHPEHLGALKNLKQRWPSAMQRDPFSNPALDPRFEQMRLRRSVTD
ncbi:glycosyltransferase [Maricaulis sp.]|uniref:glycosyltransferase family 2 protein n=1 Tax=Maricaulis sp. TaxID=1486257 RepID=UPI00262667EC|nr:glycosyltransferase [Maricaulis sp.]